MKKGFQKVELNIFMEQGINSHCSGLMNEMKKEIESAEEDYLLNVNCKEYVEYLTNKYSIDTPIIDFDQATVGGEEDRSSIATIFDDPTFTIIYDLPFTGDYSFLEYAPSPVENRKKASATRRVLSSSPSADIEFGNSDWGHNWNSEYSVSKKLDYTVFVRKVAYYDVDYKGEIIHKRPISEHILQEKVENAKEVKKAISNGDVDKYYYYDQDRLLKEAEAAEEALRDLNLLHEPLLHLEVNCIQSSQKSMETLARKAFYDFKMCAKRLITDIERHNELIKKHADKFYQDRKKRLIKHNNILSSIGLPIRVRTDLSLTYNGGGKLDRPMR